MEQSGEGAAFGEDTFFAVTTAEVSSSDPH
jgi:hypothetical protein